MISGLLPFRGDTRALIKSRISSAYYTFDIPEFKTVSDECMSLIKLMLVVIPEDRISLEKAFDHPWFSKFAQSSPDDED
jgi:serine/threonine protein kinase